MNRDPNALGAWLIRRLEDVGEAEAPDPDLVVAYAEGRLSDEERDIVEARLAESDAGRALLEALMDAGAVEAVAPPAPARGRLLQFAVLAAAAIFLAAVGLKASGLLDKRGQDPVASSTLVAAAFDAARQADSALFDGLDPLTPEELDAPGPGPERGGLTLWEPAFVQMGQSGSGFRWEPVRGATSYLLRVSNEQGEVVYEERTSTPVHVTPPDALRLVPGTIYVWEIETKTTDGTAKGRKTFRVAPPEVYRPYRQRLDVLKKKADPRVARLVAAHLAIRYELWTAARLQARAHVRDHPEDAAGQALLARIHRQLSIPADALK